MSEYRDNGYGGGDFKRNPDGGGATGEGGGPAGGGGLSESSSAYLRNLLSEKIKLSQSGGTLPFAARLLDQGTISTPFILKKTFLQQLNLGWIQLSVGVDSYDASTEPTTQMLVNPTLEGLNHCLGADKQFKSKVDRVQSQGRAHPPDRFVDVYRQKPLKVVAKVLVPIQEHPKFNFVGKLLGPKGNTMKQLQEETLCKMAVLGRGSMRDRQKEEELRTSLDPKYAHLSDDLHVEISALGPPAEAHARIAYALAEVRKYMIPDQPEGRPMPPMMERGPPMRPPPMASHRPPMNPKNKVMSILDRARAANEEPYPYEDPYARPEAPVRSGRGGADYYGYERPTERYASYEEEFYKPVPREYKTAPPRDGSGRRGGSAGGRYGARDAPYGRAPKQH